MRWLFWQYLLLRAQNSFHLRLLLWVHRSWLDKAFPYHIRLANNWFSDKLWVYLIVVEWWLLLRYLLVLHWLYWSLLGANVLHKLAYWVGTELFIGLLSSLGRQPVDFGSWLAIRGGLHMLLSFSNYLLILPALFDFKRLLLLLLGRSFDWLLIRAIVRITHWFWSSTCFLLSRWDRFVH